MAVADDVHLLSQMDATFLGMGFNPVASSLTSTFPANANPCSLYC